MITVAEPLDLDALRLRAEFLDMPGLTITVSQVARLLGVRVERARALLEALEREDFLAPTGTASFRRLDPASRVTRRGAVVANRLKGYG